MSTANWNREHGLPENAGFEEQLEYLANSEDKAVAGLASYTLREDYGQNWAYDQALGRRVRKDQPSQQPRQPQAQPPPLDPDVQVLVDKYLELKNRAKRRQQGRQRQANSARDSGQRVVPSNSSG